LLAVGLAGCGYATFSSPQYDAVRGLFPKEEGVDLDSLAWSLEWAGESQPVLPVVVDEAFIFTHRSGVQVSFDGWNITRVAGLLGQEVLTLRLSEAGMLRIASGAREVYAGVCGPWAITPGGYGQRCEGLPAREIALDGEGNITRLSFTIHPDYPALVLRRSR
jgi:hypothetical protein